MVQVSTEVQPALEPGAPPPPGLLTDAQRRELASTWERPPGLLGWLTTTNHKDIATRYIVTALVFFAMAGVLALLMRMQLARPEPRFLGPDRYNQFFTTHGTAMMFLFAVPIMEGIGLYTVPLMIGTRNVAFPRMNACGYYIYLISGILLWVSLLLNIGPDAGWFGYPPLSGPQFAPGKREDVWSQMISMSEVAALIGGVEIIVTVFKQRAPGMTLARVPIFVWAMVVTSFMVIFAMPAVMLGTSMLSMDRMAHVNTHFFNPAEGGDPLLYQHIFWFFGHPEVYIIFIPASGFVSDMLAPMCRRRVFGHNAIVLSLIATAFIGFGLWVHHMFATPIPRLGRSFFTAASEVIAIPNGIQVFCWIATIWMGRPWANGRLRVPMLFILGFLATFVLGGLTGVMLASVAVDQQVHDTYFVVAHFHYVLIGGSVFPLIGAIYYWFPKWTGRMLSERLGRVNFWTLFVGFNVAFFPMHVLGLHGMTRRIYTYIPETGWGPLNMLASIGAALIGLGVLMLVANIALSLRSGAFAGNNPWDAPTLDWATTSPPPRYNFMYLPTVRSSHPVWDREPTPLVGGLRTDIREVLTTTILDARPDHRYELAGDSVWPILLAMVVGGSFIGFVFHPATLPIAMGAAFVVLAFWFWRSNEPSKITDWRGPKAGGIVEEPTPVLTRAAQEGPA